MISLKEKAEALFQKYEELHKKMSTSSENLNKYIEYFNKSILLIEKQTIDSKKLLQSQTKSFNLNDDSLQDLLKQSSVILESIHEFKENTKKLKLIISLLKQIKQKTSLLSLNASVESAHAGEMGKGFATIAAAISHLESYFLLIGEKVKSSIKENEEIRTREENALEKDQQNLNSLKSALSQNKQYNNSVFQHLVSNIKIMESIKEHNNQLKSDFLLKDLNTITLEIKREKERIQDLTGSIKKNLKS
jgi:methyl-accepting chemotaxis protein